MTDSIARVLLIEARADMARSVLLGGYDEQIQRERINPCRHLSTRPVLDGHGLECIDCGDVCAIETVKR